MRNTINWRIGWWTVWGYVADKTLYHGLIAKLVCVVSTLTLFLIPAVAALLGDHTKNACPAARMNNTVRNITANEHDDNNKLFYTILGITTMGSFFQEAIETIVTTGILQAVRRNSGKDNYGQQMFLAPAGYAIAGFLSGILIDHFPGSHISCYTGMFIVYLVSAIGLLISFHFLFRGKHLKRRNGNQVKNVNKMLLQVLQRFETWLFFGIVLFNGIAVWLTFSFSFLYLAELKATHSLLGLSMLVNGLSSGFVYLFSQRITTVIGGPIIGMMLSYFCWTVRCLCLAFMKNPYLILPINLINGVTISIFVCSFMEHIKNKFPPSIHASVCGVATMLYNGGGGIISYLAGGTIYMEFGGKNLFVACSIVCAIWTIIIFIYACTDKCRNRQTTPISNR